jgi:site-specific recombinase XerD
VIQALLNHADLGTTAIYTKVVDAQTDEAVFRLPSSWDKTNQ